MRVKFAVSVPAATTPPDATVYLAGSLPQLGGIWKPDGMPLTRIGESMWHADVSLPRGGPPLEYKLTLGSWQTVERDADGRDIVNRRLNLSGDQEVAVTVASWANESAKPRQRTVTGDVRYHEKFTSKILGNERTIAVWLPPGYEADPSARYPVLYMHDGQNVFDDATSFAGEWRADETAGRLIREGKIKPIIIVAVANAGADRVNEYTMSRDERYLPVEGGKAAAYAKFLLDEVKPFVDRTYRTTSDREHTAVAGSSLGGLVSLFIAAEHPDRVGLCAALSPSLWWNNREMTERIRSDPSWTKQCRIWLDMGTAEDSDPTAPRNLVATRELAMILQGAGRRPGRDFSYVEVRGGDHNEQAWADRFDRVLLFLFGK